MPDLIHKIDDSLIKSIINELVTRIRISSGGGATDDFYANFTFINILFTKNQ
jgi:hypothetical protein